MHTLMLPLRALVRALPARATATLQGLAPPGWLTPVAVLALVLTVLYPPAPAWAQALTPVVTIAENIADVLTGDFARAVAVIGLAACGFLAFAGRMPWGAAIAVIIGIVLIFGAATLVDEIADIAGAEAGG